MPFTHSTTPPILSLLGALLLPALLYSEATVDYATQIKPIFEANCYQCHGPELHESSLRLDQRPSLLHGGDTGAPALVPGDVEGGELINRLTSDDAEFRMPRAADPLPQASIDLIAKWIEEGAIWPGQMDAVLEKETTTLWSMQPIVKPELPATTGVNPIDALLEAELSQHGLQVNGVADPATLIRRASIILTGLPATPERIQAFIAASKQTPETAYRELLDELFESPHYGERWAQHWLDTIRWAETTGYESNEFRKNAWPYRDYVVQSFNEDKPYDLFLREQIAGDSLGADVAMGFLVAGPHAPASTVGQQAADILQARFDRLDETIQTVTAATMGLTYACARCHNHKFDPISIKDYYSMAAVFNDIEYDHRLPTLDDEDPRAIAGQKILSEVGELRTQLIGKEDWVEIWGDHMKVHFPRTAVKSIRFNFKPGTITIDEVELFDGADSVDNLTQQDGLVVTSSKKEESLSRPAQQVIDGRHEKHFGWIHKKGESESDPWLEIEFPEVVELSRADLSADRLSHYSWQYMVTREGDPVKKPLPKGLVSIEVEDESGQRTLVFKSKRAEREQESTVAIEELNQLAARYQIETVEPLFIGRLVEPTKMHVMHRGSPASPRAEVTPMAVEVLEGDLGLASDAPGPERRLTFAQWLTEPSNPLTARVIVNRLWHHVFGTGIVSTPADLGFAGGKPSHPELLDWLAADFVENGWSVKSGLRQILMSDAFMRSSAPSESWAAVDADSRLLWRFPPRWMEAEVLRDSILVASGSMQFDMGGEGYHIHQPKSRYAQWEVTDNHGPHTWRRMLYQQRMRRVDDQMFTAFDFPDCAQVTGKRTRSTTPLQAFNLMNGKLVMEQSQILAERAMREAGPELPEQLKHMFMLTMGRTPDADELSILVTLAKHAELSDVARTLYNLNEFFYLN